MKNVSKREGDEVAQLYLSGAGGADDAVRELRGFERVHLRPGETRTQSLLRQWEREGHLVSTGP